MQVTSRCVQIIALNLQNTFWFIYVELNVFITQGVPKVLLKIYVFFRETLVNTTTT